MKNLEVEKRDLVSSYNDEKQRRLSTLQEVRLLEEMNSKAFSVLEKVTAGFIESSDNEKRAIELAIQGKIGLKEDSVIQSASSLSSAPVEVVAEINQPIENIPKTVVSFQVQSSTTDKPESVDHIIKAAEDASDSDRNTEMSKEKQRMIDNISSSYMYPSESALSVAQRVAGCGRCSILIFSTEIFLKVSICMYFRPQIDIKSFYEAGADETVAIWKDLIEESVFDSSDIIFAAGDDSKACLTKVAIYWVRFGIDMYKKSFSEAKVCEEVMMIGGHVNTYQELLVGIRLVAEEEYKRIQLSTSPTSSSSSKKVTSVYDVSVIITFIFGLVRRLFVKYNHESKQAHLVFLLTNLKKGTILLLILHNVLTL